MLLLVSDVSWHLLMTFRAGSHVFLPARALPLRMHYHMGTRIAVDRHTYTPTYLNITDEDNIYGKIIATSQITFIECYSTSCEYNGGLV